VFSQDDSNAKEYYKNGDFEKALHEYKELYAQSSSNINYITQIISTHQQLEQYDEAELFLVELMERINYPAFIVELGYNYQLKNMRIGVTVRP
jgi:tetratricopeptide (TPR) repeat protein